MRERVWRVDRKRVAFDRLLARLVAVAADVWVLKGGFALDLRLTERARMTKDIDLDWHEPDDELLDTLLDTADHDAGDFFTFRIERAGPPEDRLGGSRRFRVSASLASREFENFLLDIGFRVIPTESVNALTPPPPPPRSACVRRRNAGHRAGHLVGDPGGREAYTLTLAPTTTRSPAAVPKISLMWC